MSDTDCVERMRANFFVRWKALLGRLGMEEIEYIHCVLPFIPEPRMWDFDFVRVATEEYCESFR